MTTPRTIAILRVEGELELTFDLGDPDARLVLASILDQRYAVDLVAKDVRELVRRAQILSDTIVLTNDLFYANNPIAILIRLGYAMRRAEAAGAFTLTDTKNP